ncbi:MAG: hypothetical protein GY757_01390 [bacterium]|nr:hypothetical protein [bacterium]
MTFKKLVAFLMVPLVCLPIMFCKNVNPNIEENEIVTEDINFSTLSDLQITHLAGLAKVWGFLKYYHPVVTRGELDWDNVLMETIAEVKEAPNNAFFNRVIDDMITRTGNPDGAATGTIPSRIAWMQDDSLFNPIVREKLSAFLNSDVSSQHYIGVVPEAENPTFFLEKEHQVSSYPPEEYRILALFRYWNIIEYFFPYKDIMDRDWTEVLLEYIPRIAAAEDATQYHVAIKQLSVQINDGHAYTRSDVLKTFFGKNFAPFDVRLIENQTVVTLVRSQIEDVQVGDIILRCRDMDISDFRNQVYKYCHGSNETNIQGNVDRYITRSNEEQLKFTISRNGETKEIVVRRANFINKAQSTQMTQTALQPKSEEHAPYGWKILEGHSIGYVNMGSFHEEDISPAMEAFKDTKAIIFDVRNYPDYIVFSLCPYLNSQPAGFVKFRQPLLTQPGSYKWSKTYYCSENANPDYYKGQVIVLEDEFTMSRSEFTVMAFQTAPNCTVIGSQTCGADGDVSTIKLPGGLETSFTGIGTYYPDGAPTQRIGIVPDIVVEPTVAGIRAGIDEVLQYAIDFVENR